MLNFVMLSVMAPRVVHYTKVEKLAKDKHSSVLCPFIIYGENEVFVYTIPEV